MGGVTLHAGGARIGSLRSLIAERDGTICRRCGSPIDMLLSGLHPDGPTIGHIVSRRDGGTDDPRNLGLEHRRCNLAAGARPDPPRALIARPVETA